MSDPTPQPAPAPIPLRPVVGDRATVLPSHPGHGRVGTVLQINDRTGEDMQVRFDDGLVPAAPWISARYLERVAWSEENGDAE